jgi:metal-responsive CopG/Arc/MetJ family transcriptional regulator
MKKTGRPPKNEALKQYSVVLDQDKLDEFEALLGEDVSRSEGIRALIDDEVKQKTGIRGK